MVEYLEKMIPHADWSFLGLGIDLGWGFLSSRVWGERERALEGVRGRESNERESESEL